MLVTRSLLYRDLRGLGIKPGGVAMVRCRMSALGRVVGGAETVVRAVLDAVGPGGTLVACTGWQDPPSDALDDATRRVYVEEHPAYDPPVALQPRTRPGTRSREDLAGGAPQREPGGGRGGGGSPGRKTHHGAPERRPLRRRHALRPAGRARRQGRDAGRAAGHRDARAPRGGHSRSARQTPRELPHARARGRPARVAGLLGYRHRRRRPALRTRPRWGGLHRAHRGLDARGGGG